ncbi:hypothetical protein HG535_0D04360 [Zygotorulaspora mrakii]|uniref:BZIP domain-containing protein n=1 Tax=Zygotorulaspora mrakii TaxID=42260 RepID=A0A7H9B248_ZYGMR|nr:uncharacterized protein HG535_0D04360 [Zygotorulaspora mrakii]QLG72728.1 hypothetical protein HG535_0D04360 [Zygotorulaspora mrakii]
MTKGKKNNNESDESNISSLKVSQDLQNLISSNSELGSRLLSLLLVSSGNGKEIIDAINNGDIAKIQNLDIDLNLKVPEMRNEENNNDKNKTDNLGITRLEPNEVKKSGNAEDNAITNHVDKRRRNTEASARFRIRKKLREQEKLNRIQELNAKINGLYKNIDRLLEENRHWKAKLEELNERKSKELLERIKSGNAASPL